MELTMAQQQMGGQSRLVLSEESQRTSGRDAQSMNITAGQAVAEAIRTTLGPRGMDKMLVSEAGDVVVTNDGATILDQMDIEHPAANMVVEVAETQDAAVGDGTTSAVVVAGELLDSAEELLDRGLHPTTLVRGYHHAATRAVEISEENAIDIDAGKTAILERVASTAMTGKGTETASDLLSELVVRAVQSVTDEDGTALDDIKIETIAGGTVADSELVEGVIVGKERVSENMKYDKRNANVALLDAGLEAQETDIDTEATVTNPDQLQGFLAQEKQQVETMVEQLADVGADIVFVTGGIDDGAQHHLVEHDMLAVRRMRDPDMNKLARATEANPVGDIDELAADDLGVAGSVYQRETGTDEHIFVKSAETSESVSLILRGGTEHVAEEVERAIEDSLEVVRVAVEDGTVVPGGGTPEMAISMGLREDADSVGGREQFAIEAFADAVEAIPRTLAENSGLDPIDSLVDLRNRHHGGNVTAGLDAHAGEVVDMENGEVFEPLRVKTQAIESATEAAVMILRIDDVVAAGDLKGGQTDDEDEDPAGGPGGAPGGMGGMSGI
jgi:thermosome